MYTELIYSNTYSENNSLTWKSILTDKVKFDTSVIE